MGEITKETIENVIENLASCFDAELLSKKETELASEWYWKWDDNHGREWNTYTFSDMLEIHKRRCERWEEHHNGTCCVVERVRDKYLMSRVSEFLAALDAFMKE